MEDSSLWSANATLFGSITLTSIKTSITSNENENTFKLTFLCSQFGDRSIKTIKELKKDKPTVVSIKYKNISICNITQDDITLNTLKNSEFTVLTTERLKSIVEIGKTKKDSNTFLYYIVFSSNYQEQLAVCKNAENILR